MSRSQVEAKIAEINEKIANAKQWGAYISVLSEERAALEAVIRRLDNGPNL